MFHLFLLIRYIDRIDRIDDCCKYYTININIKFIFHLLTSIEMSFDINIDFDSIIHI